MNRIKHAFILTVDFIGLLLISSIILFALNYLKILPLSAAFPKYLGFLPQVSQKKAVLTPTPAPAAFEIVWQKQAEPALISNYSDYFKNHNISISTYNENDNLFFVSGALTAYNKDYVQIITSQGLTVFKTSDSVFRKISPPITSKNQGGDGVNRITAIYKSSADFFSDAPFGAFVQIVYKLNGDIKTATSIDYYPEYKF